MRAPVRHGKGEARVADELVIDEASGASQRLGNARRGQNARLQSHQGSRHGDGFRRGGFRCAGGARRFRRGGFRSGGGARRFRRAGGARRFRTIRTGTAPGTAPIRVPRSETLCAYRQWLPASQHRAARRGERARAGRGHHANCLHRDCAKLHWSKRLSDHPKLENASQQPWRNVRIPIGLLAAARNGALGARVAA